MKKLITLLTIVLLASCAKEPIEILEEQFNSPNTLNCNLVYVRVVNTSTINYNVNFGSITGQSQYNGVAPGTNRVMVLPLSSSVAVTVHKSDGTRFVQKFDNPDPCNIYEVNL